MVCPFLRWMKWRGLSTGSNGKPAQRRPGGKRFLQGSGACLFRQCAVPESKARLRRRAVLPSRIADEQPEFLDGQRHVPDRILMAMDGQMDGPGRKRRRAPDVVALAGGSWRCSWKKRCCRSRFEPARSRSSTGYERERTRRYGCRWSTESSLDGGESLGAQARPLFAIEGLDVRPLQAHHVESQSRVRLDPRGIVCQARLPAAIPDCAA